MGPQGDGRSRALDVACALLAAVFGLLMARALEHGDFVGDGPRFQRLLRNHVLCEHAIYLPALRASLLLSGTPEEAMRWLSALGAAGLGLGSYLTARLTLWPVGALALATCVSCSSSVLYHGGATELHAFHGGFAALLLARCLHARDSRLTGLDAALLFLTAGSHSSGGLAAMACAALRTQRIDGRGGFRFLASRSAWSLLLRSLAVALLPLGLSFALEPRLMTGYVAFIARQETGAGFPRTAFWPYVLQEAIQPAPALMLSALTVLVWPRSTGSGPAGRGVTALAFLGFIAVYGPIGIGEEGGYFVPLLPVCVALVSGAALRLASGPQAALLLVLLAAQAVTDYQREPPPFASRPKREQRALVARLPPRTLLVLYVPWEASRATQDYLWEVHDPTRDNTALFDRDPEHILAPEFRADPQAALLARVRAHRAAGRPVFMIDPAPFLAMATAGTAALAALAREFATAPAGPTLPGFVRLQ